MAKKVILGMSGGVDSSVSALLLKKKGFKVIGMFLKCWSNTKNKFGECSWMEDRRDALKICHKLGIELITIDAEKDYKKFVVDVMFRLYKRGITPNPDIICNERIKFPFLFNEAKRLGADFIATGHFARIKKIKDRYYLFRAKDEKKDQSYFLYKLKESELKKIIFPIGELTKDHIRKIAKENGFENYDKRSTVGICFIGKIDMKKFLKSRIKEKKGDIVDCNGRKIGEHDGVFFYTIGQRIGPRYGLDIRKYEKDAGKLSRWYVVKKDIKRNLLVAAARDDKIRFRDELILKDVHLINRDEKIIGDSFLSRIRHVGELIPTRIEKIGRNLKLNFKKGIDGVSEGQAAVVYEGEMVKGGGIIAN